MCYRLHQCKCVCLFANYAHLHYNDVMTIVDKQCACTFSPHPYKREGLSREEHMYFMLLFNIAIILDKESNIMQ